MNGHESASRKRHADLSYVAGRLRRFALAGSGLTFGGIAVIGVFAPHAVARAYGLALLGTDGLNEFRAVFGGFWLSLSVAMLAEARRAAATRLGDVCGLMILLQALGRAMSFIADGRPSGAFVAAFVAETATAIAILFPSVSAARASKP